MSLLLRVVGRVCRLSKAESVASVRAGLDRPGESATIALMDTWLIVFWLAFLILEGGVFWWLKRQ